MELINTVLNIVIIVILVFGALIALYFILKKFGSTKSTAVNRSTEYITPENAKKTDIKKFLPFDEITNGILVLNGGKQFAALVECSGVDYYLLSDAEKISIEEAFIQFLNSIKFPIQIYVQTRNINLDDSISAYKKTALGLQDDYNNSIATFKELDRRGASKQELYNAAIDVQRRENVINYTNSLIENISYITSSKNVLEKKYYIAVSYVPALVGSFTTDEIKNVAYTELSTKCDAIAGALTGCGIDCRRLGSDGLAEVMYNAINRSDADFLSFEKLLSSDFSALYATAKDPILKREELEGQLI